MNFSSQIKSTDNVKIENEEEMDNLIFKSSSAFSSPYGEINDTFSRIGMSEYHLKILILGFLSCFIDGSEMVVVSLIMRKLEKIWLLTPIKKATIGGCIFYGFLIGGLVSGRVMEHKGRKFSLTLGSFIFLICGIVSSFMINFYSFIFFRIGVGIGIGFIITAIQTFITEISSVEYRGFNSIIIWLGFPFGELYMCWVTSIFPLDHLTFHEANWKIIMVLAAIPVIYKSFIIR